MKTLFILNEDPYGNERSYNALRLSGALAKGNGNTVTVFLMGNGVPCGLKGQQTPNGFYNIERMLKGLIRKGSRVAT